MPVNRWRFGTGVVFPLFRPYLHGYTSEGGVTRAALKEQASRMRQGTGSWWIGKGAMMRLPILAALWTLLAVTLLSALAPLGPPLSRATGSAFNPATLDVVLKARTQSAAQTVVESPRPDGDGGPPPMLLALALAIVLLALRHARPAGSVVQYRATLRPFTPACTRRARAPPLAS